MSETLIDTAPEAEDEFDGLDAFEREIAEARADEYLPDAVMDAEQQSEEPPQAPQPIVLPVETVLGLLDNTLTAHEADPVAFSVGMFLDALGVDEGDHTADTPQRVAKAWRHLLAGYAEDPSVHLQKQFSAPENPGLVVVSGIRLASTCAHHLLPITGTATVAYRPQRGANVVGLSKLARVLDGYARRLQVQERIGSQVVDALDSVLKPLGAACVITAAHGCMSLRGVAEPSATTLTVATAGDWIDPGHPDLQAVLAEHARNAG
ncbi:GTP cyclohydrolase I [Arthrobacter sulfonylureivorans]|uniref:GTP cyclohydrolase I n=1 Tax=Arthrobacter sulfonylureivorans TaxID=2486855 RepID=UPI0039E57906